MPPWDAPQYLRFAAERTQPCRDLIARINLQSPKKLIDLGSGPGNSTQALAERWPHAHIAGLDNSPAMIDAARKSQPQRNWIVADIRSWAENTTDLFNVVFSNAAIQWVQDHATALPFLMNHVSPAGALAIQMPGNFNAPAHALMRTLATSASWRNHFPAAGVREWHVHDLPFYYDTLAPHANAIDLWETQYLHLMPDAASIVEWYKGTGLRPFLDSLPSDEDRQRFTADYLELLRPAYPPRSDGKVLFPFRRLFIVAYR